MIFHKHGTFFPLWFHKHSWLSASIPEFGRGKILIKGYDNIVIKMLISLHGLIVVPNNIEIGT